MSEATEAAQPPPATRGRIASKTEKFIAINFNILSLSHLFYQKNITQNFLTVLKKHLVNFVIFEFFESEAIFSKFIHELFAIDQINLLFPWF